MTKKNTAAWIVTTLTSDNNYTTWGPGGGDLPLAEHHVLIRGGANVPDKYMRHPEGGIVNPVTEEELSQLQANPVFKMHVENGHVRILNSEPKTEDAGDGRRSTLAAADDMEGRDKSAPLVDQDFVDGQQPITNTSKNNRRA